MTTTDETEREPLAMRVGLMCVVVLYGLVLIPFILLFAFFGPRDATTESRR